MAESLKQTFGDEADVVHAAIVGKDKRATVIFTRSMDPESSSVFREWSAPHGIAERVSVAPLDFSDVLTRLGGPLDLVKFDVEGAEIEILDGAKESDLAFCRQLTVEFHDKRPPFTRHDVDRVCRRMRAQGFAIVVANWPKVDDVLFVNVKMLPAHQRIVTHFRVAIANCLFIVRRTIFGSGYS
jgi:FkbM family methyltransferase